MMSLKRSILRAQYADGLVESFAGLGLLFAAGYLDAGRTARSNVMWMPAILPVLLMMIMRGVRRRFVYPRVGFAQPRHDFSWATVLAVVAVTGLAGVVLFVTRSGRHGWGPGPEALGWLLAVPALAGAGLAATVAMRAGLGRFWIHATVLAVAAGVPAAAGVSTRNQLIIVCLAPAAVLLPVGLFAFVRFLRTHPVQEHTNGN
jgi:hypothetical protein